MSENNKESPLFGVGLHLQAHKSFAADRWEGFESLRSVNVVIGRNNSGKSALLDAVESATALKHVKRPVPPQFVREVLVSAPLGTAGLYGFQRQYSRVDRTFVGQRRVGVNEALRVCWTRRFQIDREAEGPYLKYIESDGVRHEVGPNGTNMDHARALEKAVPDPFKDLQFKRLASERDIEPEVSFDTLSDGRSQLDKESVTKNGSGASRLIHAFLGWEGLDHQLVEVQMLSALNQVLKPDYEVESIRTQRVDPNTYEVFLEDKRDGLIRMSDSGSGLKTILLVLVWLYLIPAVGRPKRPLSSWVFAFEELENNLHPALQRRLFDFLRSFAKKNGCTLFLTTHSNVVIDLFSSDPDGQLFHVTQEDRRTQVRTVEEYHDQNVVLDDLAVQASDLLQANGVVWVEGPSDRIYFNRWIEIWSEGELREGFDYQCVFYGGSVLKHFTAAAADEKEVEDLVKLVRVNRNAILLADSDRRNQGDRLKSQLERVRDELKEVGSLCWITKGREVENYVPPGAVQVLFDDDKLRGTSPYKSFADYFEGHANRKFKKISDARNIVECLTRPMLESHLDLAARLDEVCGEIRSWNE